MATQNAPMEAAMRAAAKLSTAFPEQKEMESDEEVLKCFMRDNMYAVKQAPKDAEVEEINAFVMAEASEQAQIPRMRQLCNNMAMEFFCEDKATQWIYLTNKASECAEDETVIACKQFTGDEKSIAVFQVGDDWACITPYAYSEDNGAVAGNMITLKEEAAAAKQADNSEAPTADEIAEINAFVVSEEPNMDIMVSMGASDMELSCEGAEMIYLTNQDGDGEMIVACKQGSKATFEIMDGWNTVTPYAYKDEEATQGQEIILADEEDYPDFEQMSQADISKFYADMEPKYSKDAFQEDKESFMVSKQGSSLMIQMGIPAEHVWARAANGDLIGASQFEEESDDMSAEFQLEDGINSVRVYAFTQDGDANSMTVGAEFSL